MESAQVPQADPDQALPLARPPLFTPAQIAIGACFGTLVAAGWMARENHRALAQFTPPGGEGREFSGGEGKESRRGDLVLLAAILLTIITALVGVNLPSIFADSGFEPGEGVALIVISAAAQPLSAWVLARVAFGGPMRVAEARPLWAVAGICLMALLVVGTAGVALMLALGMTGYAASPIG